MTLEITGRAEVELRSLPPGAEIRFLLADMPLADLLLAVHETRFTGAIELGTPPTMDRVLLREGVVVRHPERAGEKTADEGGGSA